MKIFRQVLPFLAVLCLASFIYGSATLGETGLSKTNKMPTRRKSLLALLYTTNASFFDPDLHDGRNLCRWLKGLKHQRQMCQRRKGLSEILLETRHLTLSSCQRQFEFEHWNCSTSNMKKFFKKTYRETAFMYSLATSALAYAVARACQEGSMTNCKCGEHPKSDSSAEWEWGGCSVNTKQASVFVEKFLQLKKSGDKPDRVMKYNSRVGLRVVKNKTKLECKCHGVSGACTHKTCWKVMVPFDKVAENLKQLYHTAIQVEPDNNAHDISVIKKRKQLIFLDSSPNFCDSHRTWWLPTRGRRCQNIDDCATLCCGNGHVTSTRQVVEKCNCEWREGVIELKCENCFREETLYHCK
ncbi:protein Wnt-9a [Anthonomus grandis grandis]|uniref:protein Wnt-9a n=1 Tax=Anthonomus grandis grandis TaxID=2921223 RepID=UPI002165FEEB|nr:protein Wnt-9a [Anthonomus grandis grandis]